MARLNEPPMPSETLEGLKRRFIRQNRDLARHNSQQSLKIRMLESELARLRAENIAICEENIQLNAKIEESYTENFVPNGLHVFAEQEAIQREMEGKIEEFNVLVVKLSEANTRSRIGNERKRRRRSEIHAASNVEILSPNTRRLRRVLERGETEPLPQDNGDSEARMPAILEGKSYPRRTMETSQIQDLLLQATNSDSPDLGPPPTSFLDREELGEDHLQPEPMASISLGRRRRSAVLRQHDQIVAPEEVSAAPELETQATQRPSSKRKWDTQDQRSITEETAPKALNKHSVSKKTADNTTAKGDDAHGAKAGNGFSNREFGRPAMRKALASKPVNNDPVVSPRKVKTDACESKIKTDKSIRSHSVSASKSTSARTARKPHPAQETKILPILPSEPEEAVVNTVEIKLEPKTPGLVLDDIYSPLESQPREPTDSACPDTPPPITTSAGGIEGPTGIRGSRRARAQVSYAEPSLNSKMRRAGEKMDAVAGSLRNSIGAEGRGRSSSAHIEIESAKKEGSGSMQSSTSLKRNRAASTVADRHEIATDDSVPASNGPLKARLDAAAHESALDKNNEIASTSRALSNNRRRQSQKPPDVDMTTSLRTLEAADIFDVTESPSSASSGIMNNQSLGLPLKSSSSTSTLSRPSNRRQTLAGNAIPAANSSGRPGSSGSEKATTQINKRDAASTRSSMSTKSVKDMVQAPEAMSRAERVAARRRSMML